MLFLMHNWDNKMDCEPDDKDATPMTFDKFFEEAIQREKYFAEFFTKVTASMRDSSIKATNQKYNEHDRRLLQAYDDKELLIHNALMDNINTMKAMTEIANLVKAANAYMNQQEPD